MGVCFENLDHETKGGKAMRKFMLPFFVLALMFVGTSTVVFAADCSKDTGMDQFGDWIATLGKKDMEKDQLRNELAFLRHQVSPHFFMNTLNNIHSLIDIDSEDAKDAVIRLSTMMRYLLYETSHGRTSLKKEIGFIESYISLMQLRFSENVKVTLEIPKKIPEIEIPPMLFISLLENAFKHGVSYQNESFVLFSLEVSGSKLNCTIKNSKHIQNNNAGNKYSGIGLSNIKKSLELLYGKNYELEINDTGPEYHVYLSVPIE